uniref:Uncharacterized protein n=1 Tax=Caenorhabditis japonica TaxID=281687 RepID=A0A8R1E6H6_CAEJA
MSKVKPSKEIWTIPKLEMQAFKMGTVNTLKTIQSLQIGNINITESHIFTDSTIALSWVKGATDKKVVGMLVANRLKSIYNTVDQITDLGIPVRFGHVASEDNPADLGTRSCNRDLTDNTLLFNGPIPIGPRHARTYVTVNAPCSIYLRLDSQILPSFSNTPCGQSLKQWVQEHDTFTLDTAVLFDCTVTNDFVKMIQIKEFTMTFLKKRLATGMDTLRKKISGWTGFTDSPTISTEEFRKAREILIKYQQKFITPQQIKS